MTPLDWILAGCVPADDCVFVNHPAFGWTVCPRDMASPAGWLGLPFGGDAWSLCGINELFNAYMRAQRGY